MLAALHATEHPFSSDEIFMFKGVPAAKKYLSNDEFFVTEKGIFVFINDSPRRASRLNWDKDGVFVILTQINGEWICQRCGQTTSGCICNVCMWPLLDDWN